MSISLVPKASKTDLFSKFSSVYTMAFPKCAGYSSVFKIYCFQNVPAKMSRFRVPIRHIFHRFQNVLASCERGLRLCSQDAGNI